MLGLIFTLLLFVGLVSLLAPYSLLVGVMQILLIGALMVLGIQRMRALRNRLRECRLN
ncbi:MAG TPA: hypothetical protein VKB53_02815 [Gammaproteobacteria bacterium]|nr:hypothetical protein [Gammaproteobacteria bacterium]